MHLLLCVNVQIFFIHQSPITCNCSIYSCYQTDLSIVLHVLYHFKAIWHMLVSLMSCLTSVFLKCISFRWQKCVLWNGTFRFPRVNSNNGSKSAGSILVTWLSICPNHVTLKALASFELLHEENDRCYNSAVSKYMLLLPGFETCRFPCAFSPV